jgi:citrate lyase subunit beta / citryl-CoA lyase
MENPLRSLLFVPGDQADKIEKVWRMDPDAVILDLEDGVAQSQKAAARKNIQRALASTRPQFPEVLVRINSTTSQQPEDLEAAAHPGVLGIVLPKCNTSNEVVEVARALGQVERSKGMPDRSLKLFLLIESARGLLDLSSIVGRSDRVAAVIFGAEDWCLDMGIVRTKGGDELQIARWNIALCARAHGLLAIDTVFIDFHDTEGLLRDAQTARRLGFSGKLAIHPKQIDVIHLAYAPGPAEIAEAEREAAAFDEAEAKGLGVVAVDGKMIDKPVAERARRIMRLAQRHGSERTRP